MTCCLASHSNSDQCKGKPDRGGLTRLGHLCFDGGVIWPRRAGYSLIVHWTLITKIDNSDHLTPERLLSVVSLLITHHSLGETARLQYVNPSSGKMQLYLQYAKRIRGLEEANIIAVDPEGSLKSEKLSFKEILRHLTIWLHI